MAKQKTYEAGKSAKKSLEEALLVAVGLIAGTMTVEQIDPNLILNIGGPLLMAAFRFIYDWAAFRFKYGGNGRGWLPLVFAAAALTALPGCNLLLPDFDAGREWTREDAQELTDRVERATFAWLALVDEYVVLLEADGPTEQTEQLRRRIIVAHAHLTFLFESLRIVGAIPPMELPALPKEILDDE